MWCLWHFKCQSPPLPSSSHHQQKHLWTSDKNVRTPQNPHLNQIKRINVRPDPNTKWAKCTEFEHIRCSFPQKEDGQLVIRQDLMWNGQESWLVPKRCVCFFWSLNKFYPTISDQDLLLTKVRIISSYRNHPSINHQMFRIRKKRRVNKFLK